MTGHPTQAPSDAIAQQIRARVLRALADNRTPGLHFVGHFIGTRWDEITPLRAHLSVDVGPHCADAGGEANLNVVTTLIDMALANAIRAGLSMGHGTRLGTISMHIAFTGEPLTGRLDAQAHCEGWVRDTSPAQGIARCNLTADGRLACIASGTFMELPPPPGVVLAPLPWQPGGVPPGLQLEVRDLDARERAVWRRAQAALAGATPDSTFFQQLFAQFPVARALPQGRAQLTMPMALHAGNRVGHAQGGVSFAFAALAAAAAAPASQRLVEASGWFLSPGEGRQLKALAKVSRSGRRLSVVDTVITGSGGTRVLEMVSTHCALAAGRTRS